MIAEALISYAAACERASIDQRPLVWANHFDIWNTERGEIGLTSSNPDGQAAAAFAALIPFVLVPEIATSVLVLDLSGLEHRELALVRLSVSSAEVAVAHYRLPFGIDDRGALDLGDIDNRPSPFVSTDVLGAVSRVMAGRRDRFAWDEEFSFDASVQVAEAFVTALTPTES